MNLTFKHLTIHNFFSFQDAELDLDNLGFVSIVGKNKSEQDNALSNGAGKSGLMEALCWCLTGETFRGVSSGVVRQGSTDGCYVKLTFLANNDLVELTRYREDLVRKNYLSIFINGEDESGKTLRDSEKILSTMFPDITSQFLGSVIVLGQGLPYKFSSNTPSGRKEVLENISKSSFMIEEIKTRLTNRNNELNEHNLKLAEELSGLNSYKVLLGLDLDKLQPQLNALQSELSNDEKDFNSQYSNYTERLNLLTQELETLSNKITELNTKQEELNSSLLLIEDTFKPDKKELDTAYQQKLDNLQAEIVELKSKQKSKQVEIAQLENIKDVCPTCHQKIQGVHKPDLTPYKQQLEDITNQLNNVSAQFNELNNEYKNKQLELKQKEEKAKQDILTNLTQVSNDLKEYNTQKLYKTTDFNLYKSKYSEDTQQLKIKKDKIDELTKTIQDHLTKIEDINKKINYNKVEGDTLNEQLKIVSTLNSFTKRDFRGLLLKNVIEYLNKQVNEYSKDIFNTDNAVRLELNGNNIDIICHKKPYENLSGGERQKIDLIIQLSIRDMLCNQLNFTCNLLVLDEVLDYLDAKGSQEILDLISHKIKNSSSIFIITHHNFELNIPYDRKLIVEKDKGGISTIRW